MGWMGEDLCFENGVLPRAELRVQRLFGSLSEWNRGAGRPVEATCRRDWTMPQPSPPLPEIAPTPAKLPTKTTEASNQITYRNSLGL